jgi:phosphinothricin acetyltransferase
MKLLCSIVKRGYIMGIEIREFEESYLSMALDIYRWYVRNSTATFQISDPDEAQMRSLLFFPDPRHRSFALFVDGVFTGYGSVARFKEREAFSLSAELTIYLDNRSIGKGYGRAMLERLELHGKEMGFHTLIALVTGENTGSRALFSRSGYSQCACFSQVGYKCERFLDLVCFEKLLPAS